jgi:hypothetical protein
VKSDFSPDESPMTLQVGLMCADGWVLASDRKYQESGSPRLASLTKKIFQIGDLAVAVTGDDCALIAIDLIEEKITTAPEDARHLQKWLCQMGDEAFQLGNANRSGELNPSTTVRGLLVFKASESRCFWRLKIGSRSTISNIIDRDVQGDPANGVKFLVDRYHSRSLTVAQASSLAIHAINIGAELNSAYVGGGIDLIVCENAKMREVDGSNAEPETIKVEKQILELLTNIVSLSTE